MDPNKIDYYDKWILSGVVITLTAVFTVIGGNLSNITIDTVAINFLYTLCGVLLLRGLIYLLDIYLPWSKNVYTRFVLQTFSTLALYFGIQSGILFYLEPSAKISSEIIYGTYFTGVLVLLLINSLYMALYIKHSRERETNLKEDSNPSFISGRLGSNRLSIPQSKLRYIFIDNTLVRAIDSEGRTLVLNDNLTDLENDLNISQFFRANRQSIVSREIIKEVIYNSNKSCTLTLLGVNDDIVVSRQKAPKFKKWMKSEISNENPST